MVQFDEDKFAKEWVGEWFTNGRLNYKVIKYRPKDGVFTIIPEHNPYHYLNYDAVTFYGLVLRRKIVAKNINQSNF